MDPTPLTLLIGAALTTGPATVAYLIGRATGRRASPRPAALRCSCNHGYGSHQSAAKCQATVERLRRAEEVGARRLPVHPLRRARAADVPRRHQSLGAPTAALTAPRLLAG